MKSLVLATTLLAVSAFGSSVLAATVQTDASGNMTGITQVSVIGKGMYDVSFDSYPTSVSAYSSDFASAATNALYSLFTVGDLSGTAFDVNPSDPYGIQVFHTLETAAFNPYGPSEYLSHIFLNDLTSTDNDFVPYGGAMTIMEAIAYFPVEYATTWTESQLSLAPSAVPIPAAAFMFAPALLGFMGLRRKTAKVVPA